MSLQTNETVKAEDAPRSPSPRTSSKHRLSDDDTHEEPNKRRRTDHDRDGPPAQDDLIKSEEVGPVAPLLYTVSNQPVVASRPHPVQNLFSLYNLEPLAGSVARKDAVTGEKINKLRKSYEGKVKDFPGKNKAVDQPNQFFNLLMYPDEEWHIQQVSDNSMAAALSADEQELSADWMEKLDVALSMPTGSLPPAERDKWRGIIDLDSAPPSAAAGPVPSSARLQGTPPNPAAAAAQEPRRPKRKGTERTYTDEAFDGYAEGFADDFVEDVSLDGMDEENGLRGSMSRKKPRRKDSYFASTTPQYTPGAVSVGGHGR